MKPRWFVTDMDREDVKVFDTEEDARTEARGATGQNRTSEKRPGLLKFQSKDSSRARYVIREDWLKHHGFDDILYNRYEFDRELQRMVEYLSEVPCVNEISLFGSRAKGNAGPESDYDIMVWTDPGCELPEEYYKKIFSFPKKWDIKVHENAPCGSLVCVTDRLAWEAGEHGPGWTPLSEDILEDMKLLWRKK